MEIKVGDKLLCKKSIAHFIRGNIYGVFQIETLPESTFIKVSSSWISIVKIYDHFYTPEQVRKLKLDRINEI